MFTIPDCLTARDSAVVVGIQAKAQMSNDVSTRVHLSNRGAVVLVVLGMATLVLYGMLAAKGWILHGAFSSLPTRSDNGLADEGLMP